MRLRRPSRLPAAALVPVGLSCVLALATLAGAPQTTPWAGDEVALVTWGAVASAAIAAVSFLGPQVGVIQVEAPRERAASGPTDDMTSATEEALRHLNNPARLALCPLGTAMRNTLRAASEGGGLGSIDDNAPLVRARVLREVIVAFIERLRPDSSPGSDGVAAIHYWILHEEYVLGRPNVQIMTRHNLSERAFFRQRKAAVEALGRELAAHEARLPASASKDVSKAGHSTAL